MEGGHNLLHTLNLLLQWTGHLLHCCTVEKRQMTTTLRESCRFMLKIDKSKQHDGGCGYGE